VELRRSGTPVKLREQSFLVLVYLLEHAGEIVTREELRQLLWPSDTFVDFDHSLSTAVMKLREAIGDSTDAPIYIETIPKRGYRFIAPVSLATDSRNGFASSSSDVASPSTSGTQSYDETGGESKDGKRSVGRRGKPWMWLLPGEAVLVVCLAAAIWYLHRPLPPRVTGHTQLTHDGHQKFLAGTDGIRLYFNRISNLNAPASIAQVAISGGEIAQIPVALPNPSLWKVSPDGSSFLIASKPEASPPSPPTLWNVRILGGSARRLGDAIAATFSPDGHSVAYSTAENEIWLARSDGTGARKLASVGGNVQDIAWSPDGGLIRLTVNDKIWEMSSDGSNLHQLFPGWRPSSSRCCGQWTPDGRFFLFLSGESVWDRGETVLKGGEIWALDERRGMFRRPPAEPVQLTSGPISWGRPIPSKDGSTIFAEGTILRGEASRFDQKSKTFQPFLGGISAQGVVFSNDGKSVAYVSYPEEILWKANRDGSNPVQLSDLPLQALVPRWSPDGTKIVFSDIASANGRTIYIVSSEGGSPRKLLPEDNGLQVMPFWSPDGHKIVFNWGPPSRDVDWADVRILDLASGQVTTVPGSDGMIGPRWSPDGRYLVATRDELHLMIFDFKTQKWSELPQKGLVDSPEWSNNGRFIYFKRLRDDLGVFRISVKGSAAEKIVDLSDWHDAGWWGMYAGLDPTDAPLLLRDIGSDDIYALTLDQK
jgi:Tol biopolymer transport system component/DNA-binding winged helix-turn-helix (wHTH) protein